MQNAYCLTITNVPTTKWLARLGKERQVIGRAQNCDIRVPVTQNSVSRNHAQVWQELQSAWICDIGSSRGTFVNGIALVEHRETRLDHGDRILLGGLELSVIDENQLQKSIHFNIDGDETDSADTFKLNENGTAVPDSRVRILPELSHAERDVVLWVTRGLTRPEEISAKLHRSPHTVRTQMNSIFQKLGVHSRDELLGFLLRGAGASSTTSDRV